MEATIKQAACRTVYMLALTFMPEPFKASDCDTLYTANICRKIVMSMKEASVIT